MGSASEVEYSLILAHDLDMCDEAGYAELSTEVTEIKRMLTSLVQKIKERLLDSPG